MIPTLKLVYKVGKANLGRFNPFELNFAVTYLCNSRCKTCNIWKVGKKDELTIDEIEKFAQKIKFIHWVRITGGEPFLREDFVNILKILNTELDLHMLSTPTNGLLPELIEKKVRDVLKFLKPRYIITVSLDGPREIHENIRGVEGSWSRSVETFRRLKKLERRNKKFKVFFGYTISPFNVGKFEETVESVREEIPSVSHKDFHVNIFHASSVYYRTEPKEMKNFLKNFGDQASKEVREMIKRKKVTSLIDIIEKKYLRLGLKYIKTMEMPVKCNIYNLSAFVDPYGNVYPCTIFDYKIGNLRESNYDLLKILNSEEALKARKLIESKRCPQCWTPCEAHQIILSRLLRI